MDPGAPELCLNLVALLCHHFISDVAVQKKMSPYLLQKEAMHRFWSSRRQREGNCLCLV